MHGHIPVKITRLSRLSLALVLSALSLGAGTDEMAAKKSVKNETASAKIYARAIDHPGRSAADRQKDESRRPQLILPFTQLRAGDQVLELGAGGGHTTELVARVVGDRGRVYAQALAPGRVANNRLPNVVALRRHLLYQLTDVLVENGVEAGGLDRVLIFFALHDMYLNPRIDRQAVLQSLRHFLKPGGKLIILDNAADADAGVSVNNKLHRIGADFVVAEVTQAGFEFEASSNALRNAQDDHTKPWQSFDGYHDRMALRFVKR